MESLCEYIERQEEHHRRRTFQEEFRMFLEKYGVEYNEVYVWDGRGSPVGWDGLSALVF